MYFTDFVHDVLVLESNKTETSMPIGLFIKHEHGVFNLTKLLEIVFNVVQCSWSRKTTHENFFCPCH
ncbi:hypothetical protein X975_09495, partial [Stegodyphus mimosarum]